ncbi:MAG: prolipoprotein diacylglyceryl transferase [Candidatus Omnitrophica bacterium]|nr:prolipoprotein diacylglyceryl transferase [Candidatus Omnitrophota bacterium]
MHPILFQIGPLTIYSYGLMVACAFIVGTYLASREAIRQNIPEQKIVDIALILAISGIVGGRLLYVLQNFDFYLKYPLQIIMLHKGGLSFFGGLFFALICMLFFLKLQNLPVLKTVDLFTPYLALGHAIGRIGCLLNGCCYGKQTSHFFALYFPADNIPRYPVQVYSSLGLVVIFIILRFWQERLRDKPRFQGQIFIFYCFLYSMMRFFMEYLRGDHQPVFAGVNVYQLVSIVIFIFSGALLWKRRKGFLLK